MAASLPAEDRPEIVFVTAYEQFAPDAFDVEAVDYLMKPVRFDRLRQAIERARRRRHERLAAATLDELVSAPAPELGGEDIITVPDPRGNRYVAVSAIDWIEAAKDYVLLHTAERSHMLRITMAELERRLDPSVMVRVHRSAFVRRDAIVGIDRPLGGTMTLLLPGEIKVSVGPSYLRSVAAELRALL